MVNVLVLVDKDSAILCGYKMSKKKGAFCNRSQVSPLSVERKVPLPPSTKRSSFEVMDIVFSELTISPLNERCQSSPLFDERHTPRSEIGLVAAANMSFLEFITIETMPKNELFFSQVFPASGDRKTPASFPIKISPVSLKAMV